MRINENIFKGKGNFLDNDYRNYYSTKIIKIEDKILYAKVDDIALFYINIDTSDFDAETITMSADIGNRGNIPLYVQSYGLARPFSEKMVNAGETYRFEHTSELREKITNIRITCRESGDLAFYLKNIKIEKGDKATPYIPNENTIETAKRQYFIGGGSTFKEVYPI